ncbi:MAG: transrane transport protein [Nocardioides sp.]|nr:transrane transport protein [Nocardioides sp.]
MRPRTLNEQLPRVQLQPSVNHSPWRSLRHRSMRLWAAANTVSNIGTWMQMVSQNLLILDLTGSVAMAGVALSAQALPALLFGIIGGAAVDGLPHKLAAGLGQFGLATIALTTAVLATTGAISVPILLVLSVLSGLVSTIDGPACSLLGNDLVPRVDLSSAIAVSSVGTNIGRLVGTGLAGVILSTTGIPAAYVINGISFLLVAGCIPFLRLVCEPEPAQPHAAVPADPDAPHAGLRYVFRNHTLLGLLAIGALTSMLGRNYSMTMAALVTGPLHGTAADYTKVGVALAVGGMLGAIVAGRVRQPSLRLVVLFAIAAASLQVTIGLSPVLIMVVVLAVPMAIAESATATTTATMLQSVPPRQLRGRVLGVWRTASAAWGLAGPVGLGLVLEATGERGGLVIGGVAAVLLLVAAAARPRPGHPETAVEAAGSAPVVHLRTDDRRQVPTDTDSVPQADLRPVLGLLRPILGVSGQDSIPPIWVHARERRQIGEVCVRDRPQSDRQGLPRHVVRLVPDRRADGDADPVRAGVSGTAGSQRRTLQTAVQDERHDHAADVRDSVVLWIRQRDHAAADRLARRRVPALEHVQVLAVPHRGLGLPGPAGSARLRLDGVHAAL